MAIIDLVKWDTNNAQQQQQPRQNTSPVRKAVPRSAPVATDLIGDL